MRGIRAVLFAALLFEGVIQAQAVCTATAVQPLVVTRTINTTVNSTTIPVGPLPPAGVRLATPALSSIYAWLDVVPQIGSPLPPGATGWAVYGELNATFDLPAFAATSALGRVRLQFQSPQPVSGLLYLVPSFRHSPPFQTFSGDASVDTDCDGVPEYVASSLHDQNVQIPVVLDASGTTLCVDLNLSGSLTNAGFGTVSATAFAAWNILFLPGFYALEQRASGCAPIRSYRDPYNFNWHAVIGSGPRWANYDPIVAGFFLLGLGEQHTPLAFLPNCPLLVASPVIVPPAIIGPTSLTLIAPDVTIPLGMHFYCQAVWLDTQQHVYTSDSIRTM